MRSANMWSTTPWTLAVAMAALAAFGACGTPDGLPAGRDDAEEAASTAPLGETPSHVRATVQRRPGASHEEMDMAVHAAPTDLATRAADEVDLDGDELVLGVVVEGQPVAYPVRYLALSEVVNDRVAETPIAPSW